MIRNAPAQEDYELILTKLLAIEVIGDWQPAEPKDEGCLFGSPFTKF